MWHPWHLIVSIPDLCLLSHLDWLVSTGTHNLEVIKLFSCLTQLNMNFILVIHIKMTTSVDVDTFISRIKSASENFKRKLKS